MTSRRIYVSLVAGVGRLLLLCAIVAFASLVSTCGRATQGSTSEKALSDAAVPRSSASQAQSQSAEAGSRTQHSELLGLRAIYRVARPYVSALEDLLTPWGLYALLTLVFLWLSARCYLSERYARRALDDSSCTDHGSQEVYLLPSQRHFVNTMEDLIRSQRPHDSPLLVAAAGEWGLGKTFLMRQLKQRLDQSTSGNSDPEPCVIYVDIWRHSTEEDLHLSLLEALLSHPRVPPGIAFFKYPVSLIPVLLLRYLSKVFGRGRIEVASLRLSLSLPALLWQNSLEHMVALVREQGHTVIWILDEIDRCSPELAQAAIALTRRALGIHGCTVVLPYVEDQLAFKVFNPLIISRPDIRTTMQALIWGYATSGRSHSIAKSLTAETSERSLHLLGERSTRTDLRSINSSGSSPAKETMPTEKGNEGDPFTWGPSNGCSGAGTVEDSLQWWLGRWFADAHNSAFRRLSFLFGEKYLSRRVPLDPLEPSDVAAMVQNFRTLRSLYERYFACRELLHRWEAGDNPQRAISAQPEISHQPQIHGLQIESTQVSNDIKRAIKLYNESRTVKPQRRPTVRHLDGELFEKLKTLVRFAEDETYLEFDPEGRASLSRVELVFTVLLSYHRATEHLAVRRPD